MSFVDIRVDLPSYSLSFTVTVPEDATVLDLKREIYYSCQGQPRTDGQRLIWRGRVLADDESIDSLWKTGPRIVHLAVRPAAWSTIPPILPQPQQDQSQSQFQPQPTPIPPSMNADSIGLTPMRADFYTPPTRTFPTSPMVYVLYQHRRALSCLSSAIPPPSFTSHDGSRYAANLSINALRANGFVWPDILDFDFPHLPEEGGVEYKVSVIEGQTYLELVSSDGKPTALQEHALKVLSVTLSILTLSLLAPPFSPTGPSQPNSPAPHVNQLFQQFGIPPLRPVNNNNRNVAANINQPPNQANAAVVDIRQIPIRPLLAPLMLLLFRTFLLLYFVAPTRKPIFGVLVLAWMLYEVWQPIRNAMRNGLGRAPDGQQQRGGDVPLHGQNADPGNAPFGQGAAAGPDGAAPAANRPGPLGPMTLDQQAAAIFDNLANLNIEEEERMLNQAVGAIPPVEPGLGHKVTTFLGLLLTTLHPAIWNRRRVALRRRESDLRLEANARIVTPSENEGEGSQAISEGERVARQRRDALRTQFERRPRWIQRYMERVVDEDWVDDSD